VNVALWIAAGVLCAVYAVGSVSKLLLPKETLAGHRSGRWVEDFDARAVKAIGGVEALAAVGLILPAVLDIAPVLVPLAALGATLLMAGAVVTRLRRREREVVLDLAYFALAVFVAAGRFGPESFTG